MLLGIVSAVTPCDETICILSVLFCILSEYNRKTANKTFEYNLHEYRCDEPIDLRVLIINILLQFSINKLDSFGASYLELFTSFSRKHAARIIENISSWLTIYDVTYFYFTFDNGMSNIWKRQVIKMFSVILASYFLR